MINSLKVTLLAKLVCGNIEISSDKPPFSLYTPLLSGSASTLTSVPVRTPTGTMASTPSQRDPIVLLSALSSPRAATRDAALASLERLLADCAAAPALPAVVAGSALLSPALAAALRPLCFSPSLPTALAAARCLALLARTALRHGCSPKPRSHSSASANTGVRASPAEETAKAVRKRLRALALVLLPSLAILACDPALGPRCAAPATTAATAAAAAAAAGSDATDATTESAVATDTTAPANGKGADSSEAKSPEGDDSSHDDADNNNNNTEANADGNAAAAAVVVVAPVDDGAAPSSLGTAVVSEPLLELLVAAAAGDAAGFAVRCDATALGFGLYCLREPTQAAAEAAAARTKAQARAAKTAEAAAAAASASVSLIAAGGNNDNEEEDESNTNNNNNDDEAASGGYRKKTGLDAITDNSKAKSGAQSATGAGLGQSTPLDLDEAPWIALPPLVSLEAALTHVRALLRGGVYPLKHHNNAPYRDWTFTATTATPATGEEAVVAAPGVLPLLSSVLPLAAAVPGARRCAGLATALTAYAAAELWPLCDGSDPRARAAALSLLAPPNDYNDKQMQQQGTAFAAAVRGWLSSPGGTITSSAVTDAVDTDTAADTADPAADAAVVMMSPLQTLMQMAKDDIIANSIDANADKAAATAGANVTVGGKAGRGLTFATAALNLVACVMPHAAEAVQAAAWDSLLPPLTVTQSSALAAHAAANPNTSSNTSLSASGGSKTGTVSRSDVRARVRAALRNSNNSSSHDNDDKNTRVVNAQQQSLQDAAALQSSAAAARTLVSDAHANDASAAAAAAEAAADAALLADAASLVPVPFGSAPAPAVSNNNNSSNNNSVKINAANASLPALLLSLVEAAANAELDFEPSAFGSMGRRNTDSSSHGSSGAVLTAAVRALSRATVSARWATCLARGRLSAALLEAGFGGALTAGAATAAAAVAGLGWADAEPTAAFAEGLVLGGVMEACAREVEAVAPAKGVLTPVVLRNNNDDDDNEDEDEDEDSEDDDHQDDEDEGEYEIESDIDVTEVLKLSSSPAPSGVANVSTRAAARVSTPSFFPVTHVPTVTLTATGATATAATINAPNTIATSVSTSVSAGVSASAGKGAKGKGVKLPVPPPSLAHALHALVAVADVLHHCAATGIYVNASYTSSSVNNNGDLLDGADVTGTGGEDATAAAAVAADAAPSLAGDGDSAGAGADAVAVRYRASLHSQRHAASASVRRLPAAARALRAVLAVAPRLRRQPSFEALLVAAVCGLCALLADAPSAAAHALFHSTTTTAASVSASMSDSKAASAAKAAAPPVKTVPAEGWALSLADASAGARAEMARALLTVMRRGRAGEAETAAVEALLEEAQEELADE